MPHTVDYPTASEARSHLKDILDSVQRGRTVTVRRDSVVSAVLPADRLRDFFFHAVSPLISVTQDGGHVVALMEERPFVSEGADVEAALDDLALSLREYAEDWEERLQQAPNHRQNWALVQLVKLSTDEELLEWFRHGGE